MWTPPPSHLCPPHHTSSFYANCFTTYYKYEALFGLSPFHFDTGLFLSPNFCPRMTALLCFHSISGMSSYSGSFLFLLLLTGPNGPLALSPGRVRGRPEGRARVRWRGRSGGKDKGQDRASIAERFVDSGVSKQRAVATEDGEGWGDTEATNNFRPQLLSSEGGLWEPRSSSHCIPIPSAMDLCQNIGYHTMRMPNLLGHDSPAEAVQHSSSWLPLLVRECHPDARIFLCSLFAPICLDRSISPCRSLCQSVRDSCEPIMTCYGYPWPDILRCDQYPVDYLMCISSMTNTSVHTGGRIVPRATCQDCELEEASSSKDTLETFCRSDFVVKIRLIRLKYSPVSLSLFSLAAKLDVLKHGPLLGGQIRSRVELWLERDATCVRNMTRQHPQGGTFLLTGTVQGEHLVVNKAYAWHKQDKNLMAAARKWKRHRCRN